MKCMLCGNESETKVCSKCFKDYNLSGELDDPKGEEIYSKEEHNKLNPAIFQNIGKKIKGFAIITAVLGIIIAIIIGSVFIYFGVKGDNSDFLILIGLAIGIIGSLFSWISALFLYGYGEIIDRLNEIAHNTKK